MLTDIAKAYRFRRIHGALSAVEHRFTRTYRPQTNRKVERFHRTLLEEWAYVRQHRVHTAIGGPPASRVTNLPPEYIQSRVSDEVEERTL